MNMAKEPNFTECWLDFKSRSNQNKVAVEFLKDNVDLLGLNNTRRILSIGPGDGEVDVALISVLPDVIHYSAIEPDAALRKTVEQNVRDLGRGIEVSSTSDTMESFSGPDEPVDIILMIHVCYYFPDTFNEAIKRALQWLTPEGHLILIHKQFNPFRSDIEDLMNSNESSRTISVAWNISEKLKSINIPFNEFSTDITLDWTLPGLASIVRIFTDIYPNEEQLEKCVVIARQYSKPNQCIIQEQQLIHVIPHSALGYFK